jgi:HK97 family phage major capsid protein/HK97 family phage prohead protease
MEPQQGLTLVHIKAIDAERRTFTGMATTPKRDRQGDIVDPMGVKFRNPLPLLFHHDTKQPIGTVTFQRPTEDGVAFEASIAAVDEPGALKDRVDEAWQSVKAGLITAVSIGWRALENGIELLRDGTALLKSIEVVELSLVTIPANAEARILSVKELDQAATGRHSPGAAGTLPVVRAQKGAPAMTIPEQITSFENQRAAKAAAMTALMTKSEGATLDAAQREEYTTLEREVDAIDEHLPRLRKLEKTLQVTAAPVVPTTTTKAAGDQRGGAPVVTVTPNVPKGTAFTRFVIAKVMGKNSMADAIAYAESRKDWMEQTPEVLLALKAAVNPGTIAEPAWAAPLAVARPMQNEWLELLRPATLIGKIPGLRQVPFNISMPVQTGGGTYGWVGEGAPKPVGNLQFTSATLGIAKAAGIIVISEELAKISSPSAEAVVRNDMIKGMAAYLDQQFIDPTVAAVANVSPASITNAAVSIGSAGTSAANAGRTLPAWSRRCSQRIRGRARSAAPCSSCRRRTRSRSPSR